MTAPFNDRPFHAGVLTGIRGFELHHSGVLVGPQLRRPWKAGENVAVCHPDHWWSYGQRADVQAPGSDHTVAGKDCSCGFYAYFTRSGNDYNQPGRTLQAVIQGYGVATVGSRGFRAGKARILGIYLNGVDNGREVAVSLPRMLATYPDVQVHRTLDDLLEAYPLTSPEDVGVEPIPNAQTGVSSSRGGFFVMGTGLAVYGHHVHMHRSLTPPQPGAGPTPSSYANGGVVPAGLRIGKMQMPQPPKFTQAQIDAVAQAMSGVGSSMAGWQKAVLAAMFGLDQVNAAASTTPPTVRPLAKTSKPGSKKKKRKAPKSDPYVVAFKKANAQDAALRREGLNGTGGFDRRGRRR